MARAGASSSGCSTNASRTRRRHLAGDAILRRVQAADLVARGGRARLAFSLRKLLGSADGAEDALQEVWLDVHRGLRKLRNPAAFPVWIYRIACQLQAPAAR